MEQFHSKKDCYMHKCLLGSNVLKNKLEYMFSLVLCFLTGTPQTFIYGRFLFARLFVLMKTHRNSPIELTFPVTKVMQDCLSNHFAMLFASSPFLYKTELAIHGIRPVCSHINDQLSTINKNINSSQSRKSMDSLCLH